MDTTKPIKDLPEAQQRMLALILTMRRPAFRTSDMVQKNISGKVDGRSIGALLGSLHKNGYLDKVQGGRDKLWRLSNEAARIKDEIRKQIAEVKQYWS